MRVFYPRHPKLLTVEEWVQHPAGDQYELIDGLLRGRGLHPNGHEFAVARVGSALIGHLLQTGITNVVLGSRAKYRVRARRGIMPDVSVLTGWKAEAIDPKGYYNTVGPDLAVEVLSPEQDSDYIEERLDDYWKLDTMEVWIVDPWTDTVTGYTRGTHGFEAFEQAQGDEEFSSRLLQGLSFSVARLWMRRP
jgi:Uma2 family endonuclease